MNNMEFRVKRSDWERRIEDVIIEMQQYKQSKQLEFVRLDISAVTLAFNHLMDSTDPDINLLK